MSYKGKIIKSTKPSVTRAGASGVWNLEDVSQSIQDGTWVSTRRQETEKANTVFTITANGTDGANSFNRDDGTLLNIGHENLASGHATVSTAHYEAYDDGNLNINNANDNPYDDVGYYCSWFHYENQPGLLEIDHRNNYLSHWSSDSAFMFGSAEATLEFFIYTKSNLDHTHSKAVISNRTRYINNSTLYTGFPNNFISDNEQSHFVIYDEYANLNRMEFWLASYNTGARMLQAQHPHKDRGWVHVAITRDESTSNSVFRMFLNGMLTATQSTAKGKNWGGVDNNYRTMVGDEPNERNSWYLIGGLSNLRATRGIPSDYRTTSTVVGTQCFDPPTEPLTTTSQGADTANVTYLGFNDNHWRNTARPERPYHWYDEDTNQPVNRRTRHRGWGNSQSNLTSTDYYNRTPHILNTSPFHGGDRNFKIKVGTGISASNVYFIDEVSAGHSVLTLHEGFTYTFDQSHTSNATHAIRFSTTEDGTHGGGVQFTDGFTAIGTAGTSGAYSQLTLASGTETLYYYCVNHSGMGGKALTPTRYIPRSEQYNYGSAYFRGAVSNTYYRFVSSNGSLNTNHFSFSAQESFSVEFWGYENYGYRNPTAFFGSTGNGFLNFQIHSKNLFSKAKLRRGPSTNIIDVSVQPTYNMSCGQWIHYAVCRDGANNGKTSIYIQGERVGTTNYANEIGSGETTCHIGGGGGSETTNYFKMSNFRFIKGATAYDPSASMISLPSSPLPVLTGLDAVGVTADNSFQVVTFQTNRAPVSNIPFDRSKYQNRVQAVCNAPTNVNKGLGRFSPFVKPFGFWSVYFPERASFDLDNTSGNTIWDGFNANDTFTIEGWINHTKRPTTSSGSNLAYIFCKGGNPIKKGFGVTSDGRLKFYGNDDLGSDVEIASAADVIPLGVWKHVALSVGSGTLRLFVDGTQVASGSYASLTDSNGGALRVGIGVRASYAAQGFTGYISNLRASNNQRYTGSFTIPYTPLSSDANTQFLFFNHYRFTDSGPNNLVPVHPYGAPKVVPTNPFVEPYTVYDPMIHGSSYYHFCENNTNAQNNYLRVYNTNVGSVFEPEEKDFTMEYWLYPETISQVVGQTTQRKGSRPTFYVHNGQHTLTLTPADSYGNHMYPNTWNHVVIQKKRFGEGSFSNTTRDSRLSIYLNGNRIAENTAWTTLFSVGNYDLYIGRRYHVAAGQIGIMEQGPTTSCWFLYAVGDQGYGGLRGYISGLRFIKDGNTFPPTDTTYTVPTRPNQTTNQETVFEMNTATGAEYGISNVINSSNVCTIGECHIDTQVTKFGKGSLKFQDNGHDFLITPYSPDHMMEQCSFTIECWIRFEDKRDTSGIFQIITETAYPNNNTTAPAVWLRSSTSWNIYMPNNTNTNQGNNTAYNALQEGVWYHLALCRDMTQGSNNTALFVDGVRQLQTHSTTYLGEAQGRVVLGAAYQSNGWGLAGYIDSFRITKGICRYDVTASNITVPTEEFPAN